MSAPARLFAYGSLVSATSAALTLGRAPPRGWTADRAVVATLRGWRRDFSQCRDNLRCEKTFALDSDASLPSHVLGLNVRRSGSATEAVNGVLLTVSESELARLDRRELRYDRIEVDGEDLETASEPPACIWTYTAKPEHLAVEPPPGAVILRSYLDAVESAFAELGPSELDRFRRHTGIPAVEIVEAHLVADRIPAGNPRRW